MQLPVPERSVADTGSFPVAPDGVADWLATLDPLASEADAREVLRGLTHSNRLHNDVDQRRAVIACFVPTLRALQERLGDTARAQPLPLAEEFARAADLALALLREEAIAFRLLLADSRTPLADDARRAMLALTRRADLLLSGYRQLPDALLREAHALFGFAREHHIHQQRAGSSEPGAPAMPSLASLDELYRYLLVLTVVDAPRHRARQLPLLFDWLREHASLCTLAADAALARRRASTRYAIDLNGSACPAPTGSVLAHDDAALLVIDTTPLCLQLERQLSTMRQTNASQLGADTLERQTLARLEVTLDGRRQRRHGRRREDRPIGLTFGHKDICARLRYAHGDDESLTMSGWRAVDASPAGLQATHVDAAPGSVQVGELVAIPRAVTPVQTPDGTGASSPTATRRDISLAVVRRIRARDTRSIAIGLEFLAHAVMPVTLRHDDDPDSAPEQALIIACRIGERSVQSLLVPPFLYRSGDRLSIGQGERSRQVELTRCLQLNGLFGHYELGDAAPA